MLKQLPAVIAAIILPSIGNATFTNAAANFSTTSNPNNGWSFGSTATFGGAFTTFTTPSVVQGMDFWGFRADAAKNNTSSTFLFDGRVKMDPGQLTLHPGTSSWSVARYTVPAGITKLNINSTFTAVDTVGTGGISIIVRAPGTTLFSESLGFQESKSYSGSIFVNAGQTLDFYVGTGADSNFVGDSTALSATIEAVPEPSTMLALGLGLAAISRRRRK